MSLPYPEFEEVSNPGMIQTPNNSLSRRRNIFCGIPALKKSTAEIISAPPSQPLISYCRTPQLFR